MIYDSAFKVLKYSPQSPALNPIEQPAYLQQLCEATLSIWSGVTFGRYFFGALWVADKI